MGKADFALLGAAIVIQLTDAIFAEIMAQEASTEEKITVR
jgi:hypothetical protein